MNINLVKVIDDMFNNQGWIDFSSVLEELNIETSAESCRKAFDTLPVYIKLEAVSHGMSDTCVRDQAYVYLRDNKYTG